MNEIMKKEEREVLQELELKKRQMDFKKAFSIDISTDVTVELPKTTGQEAYGKLLDVSCNACDANRNIVNEIATELSVFEGFNAWPFVQKFPIEGVEELLQRNAGLSCVSATQEEFEKQYGCYKYEGMKSGNSFVVWQTERDRAMLKFLGCGKNDFPDAIARVDAIAQELSIAEGQLVLDYYIENMEGGEKHEV